MKAFDKILVRDSIDHPWKPAFFWRWTESSLNGINEVPLSMGGNLHKYAIPYEGNELLVDKITGMVPGDHKCPACHCKKKTKENTFNFGDHVYVKNDESDPWRKGIYIKFGKTEMVDGVILNKVDLHLAVLEASGESDDLDEGWFKKCIKADW